MKQDLEEGKTYDLVVIGAGFAGSMAALELLRDGRDVLLIESEEGVCGRKSSSFNECYKLHTGMHYLGDYATAEQCLIDSISFAKEFPDCILGGDDLSLPWRRGRHFLMSNSLFPRRNCEIIAKRLKQKYTELVEADRENKVFGEPENFIKYLDAKEYPHVSKSISQITAEGERIYCHVDVGVETGESQIDVEKLKTTLEDNLSRYKSLTFATMAEVKGISFLPSSFGHSLEVYDKRTSTHKIIHAENIVNCTWQNIEALERGLGYDPCDNRIVRVKVTLLIAYPPHLKNINTCIFSVGPHCSVTNMGNGTAILSYEPATNVGSYLSSYGPQSSETDLTEIIRGDLTPTEGKGKEIANRIVRGASQYIPGLSACKVLEVRVGHVKMLTKEGEVYSIYSKESPIHRRSYHGVEWKSLGYIANASIKMTYAHENANRVKRQVNKDTRITRELYDLIHRAYPSLMPNVSHLKAGKVVLDTLLHHSFRHSLFTASKTASSKPTEESIRGQVAHAIRSKKSECLSLTRFFHRNKERFNFHELRGLRGPLKQ